MGNSKYKRGDEDEDKTLVGKLLKTGNKIATKGQLLYGYRDQKIAGVFKNQPESRLVLGAKGKEGRLVNVGQEKSQTSKNSDGDNILDRGKPDSRSKTKTLFVKAAEARNCYDNDQAKQK